MTWVERRETFYKMFSERAPRSKEGTRGQKKKGRNCRKTPWRYFLCPAPRGVDLRHMEKQGASHHRVTWGPDDNWLVHSLTLHRALQALAPSFLGLTLIGLTSPLFYQNRSREGHKWPPCLSNPLLKCQSSSYFSSNIANLSCSFPNACILETFSCSERVPNS